MTFVEIVDNNTWFEQFVKNMPKRFIPRIDIISISDKKIIIRKGKASPYVYFIIKGKVIMINEYSNGRIFNYASKNAPGFLGLLEYFSNQKLPSTTIRASGDVLVMRMPVNDFSNWVENDFDAYKLFTRYFASNIFPSIENKGKAIALSKKHMLLDFFIMQYSDEIQGAGSYRIPLTKEEISFRLGVSERTIYRILQELVHEGLINIDHGKIKISDSQLEKILNYQYPEEE